MRLLPIAGLLLALASCQSTVGSAPGMIPLLERYRGEEVQVYTAGSGERAFSGKVVSVDAAAGILTLAYEFPKNQGGSKGTHSIRIDQIQVVNVSSK